MSDQPEWLRQFADNVCACLIPIEAMPPIGCHVARVGDCWEITLFISPTEIVGGQYDGERIPSLFVLDSLEVQHLFDVVDSASWQPHPVNELDELGAHFSVTGYVQGNLVWLRILGEVPQRFESGRFANLLEQRFMETWET